MLRHISEKQEYYLLLFLLLTFNVLTVLVESKHKYEVRSEIGREYFPKMDSLDTRTRQTNEKLNQTDWELKRFMAIVNADIYKGRLNLNNSLRR